MPPIRCISSILQAQPECRKGVLRDNGGHAVALYWTMKNLYDINPGEVWWSASDVGWVVGHSYIVYAPLLQGSTTVFYEGNRSGLPMPAHSGGSFPSTKVKSSFHRTYRLPGHQKRGSERRVH
jgi:hypothetical protein